MSEYEDINASLNKILRALDSLAREIVELENNPDKDNLVKMADAIAIVSEVQKSIWAAEPGLSVHYGDEQEDSKFMSEFRAHLICAYKFEKNNDVVSAINELKKAVEMEPPPLMHEAAIREFKRLQEHGS